MWSFVSENYDVCDKGFKKTIYMHVTANRDKELDLSGD